MKVVGKSDNVSIHYKGTLSDGQLFDTSEGKDPLTFEVGSGQVIPGFDKAVVGMKVDESKVFTVPSTEAYGEVKDDLLYQVPVSSIPAELNPHEGQRLVSNLEDGREIPVTVKSLKEDIITLDANHPLAGKDLTFDIKILEIK
tara:strand:+ start:230 stop:658 length:429 start_codon:yes stop_codon:yes gene_type:complete